MKKSKQKFSFERDLKRLPGQSVDDEFNDLFNEKVSQHMFLIGTAFFWLLITWVYWFQDVKPNPYLISVICLGIICFSAFKIRKYFYEGRKLRQGRDGERYVGQMLEELRADGNQVFHDIVGEGFNIDHVIIGPNGIYVIETKTWANNATIKEASYDGKTLKLNGHATPKNPIVQVQAEARWLSDILHKSTGNKFFVKPIIALPSKFIDPSVNKALEKENIRLLNPKTIATFVKNDGEGLSSEQVSQASLHLSRIITSKNI